MKRFATYLIIWTIVIGILVLIIDCVITSGLRHCRDIDHVVWNDIFQEQIDADVLIVGNSRVRGGISTYLLDSILGCNSYNLGMDGHTFEGQYIRYNTYRRFNKPPKVILLSVDYFTSLTIAADPQYKREQFFPWITDDSLINAVEQMKDITWQDRYIPMYRYWGYHKEVRKGLLTYLNHSYMEDLPVYKGYYIEEEPWKPADSTKIHYIYNSPKIDSIYHAFFRHAQSDGIYVIMVEAPTYYTLQQQFIGKESADSIFASYSELYNVPILDFLHPEFDQDTSCFHNASHLSKKGAELFTKELADSLKMAWWK